MPEGKNAELARRTAEMQLAMARVIAECHADGMRDGLNHAGVIVSNLAHSLRVPGADAAALGVLGQVADLLQMAAHEVVPTAVDPKDFGVQPLGEDEIREQLRRFLDV